jgi:hydrogenase maturation protein HypF
MFRDIDEIRKHCEMNPAEEALLLGSERPIVLLKRHANNSRLPPSIAPGNKYLGVFLPYTPLHHLLFEDEGPQALVMTSGNQSDEPIVMENGQARSRLHKIADAFLLHDRDIYMRCDDSVVRVLNGETLPVRRARGYVPEPLFLKDKSPPVLAVGAELKNTVCLTRGDEAFLSQHVGDLENLETLRSFEHLIGHLKRIFQIEPRCIVHDLHPDYLSTQWALAQTDLPRFAVQHHHAHIASVVAESRIEGPVIGIALDGTGYGTDGTVWGGEILRVDGPRFERIGHLRQVPLPGGSMAIKEPWRMALSYLWSLDPDGVENTFGDFLDRWPPRQVQVLLQMLRKGVNSPITSSCGRLFDAASALLDIRRTIHYEGQAAIELEQALEPDEGAYPGRVLEVDGRLILDTLPLILSVIGAVRSGAVAGSASARFHNGMVGLLSDAAVRARDKTGLERVALSGGVFGNIYLSERLGRELERRGLQVFMHRQVPANDACISLGQAHVGACLLKEQEENPS